MSLDLVEAVEITIEMTNKLSFDMYFQEYSKMEFVEKLKTLFVLSIQRKNLFINM